MAKNKYFKGTISEFKEYLRKLYASNSIEDQERYVDIKNSVVYISEHMGEEPTDESAFHCSDGAVYAHGAIIAGISAQEEIDKIKEEIKTIDSSVSALEEIIKTGVVNSVLVNDNIQSEFVGISADSSRGNITVSLNGNVVDASSAEYQGLSNNGLATVGYVEERLDYLNWEIIQDSEKTEETIDQNNNVSYISESEKSQLININDVDNNAASLTIKSSAEVTVEGK